MQYSNKELDLIKESLDLGCTYKNISEFIYEDFGITRTPDGIRKKCTTLGWRSINKTRSHEQFVQDIKDRFKVIGTYINNHTKIEIECKQCNHIWFVLPRSVLYGKGCPECAKRNHGGGYNRMSKKQADTLCYPLYLYNIKLEFEGEVFYKIGLTKNEDRSRYYQYKPYKVIEEISFEKYDAWTAICKEKDLISNYKPLHYFEGWTECYRMENGK